jgi:hypothetical protein
VTDKFGRTKFVRLNKFGKLDDDFELHMKMSDISTSKSNENEQQLS